MKNKTRSTKINFSSNREIRNPNSPKESVNSSEDNWIDLAAPTWFDRDERYVISCASKAKLGHEINLLRGKCATTIDHVDDRTKMFDVPPKCPALADKLTGLFSWRHTYRVHHRQKGIPHTSYLHKSYSLTLPRRTSTDATAEPTASDALTVNKWHGFPFYWPLFAARRKPKAKCARYQQLGPTNEGGRH